LLKTHVSIARQLGQGTTNSLRAELKGWQRDVKQLEAEFLAGEQAQPPCSSEAASVPAVGADTALQSAAVAAPSTSAADPSLAPAVSVAVVGASAAPNSGGGVPAASAASLAAAMRASSAALLCYAEQLERDKSQLTQDKAQLQRQLDERTAELASAHKQLAAASSHAERLIVVKREKLDAQADAHGAAQLTAKAVAGKRKAETERKSEAKRRRAAEAARDEMTERNAQLQSALLVNPKARPDCSTCFENPTTAVCLPCGHLVSCIDCAKEWQTSQHTCPVCRRAVAQVVQTYLASESQ
jgi:hypothetical protein